MKILIDTREQEPLSFGVYEGVVTSRDNLIGGDYTLVGHDMPRDDDSIIIERKRNCLELVRNLGADYDRFIRQMELMREYRHKQIIVCAPANFEYLYSSGFTKLHPNFVYKQITEIFINYGISIVYLPNRDVVENYIYRIFVKILRDTREND